MAKKYVSFEKLGLYDAKIKDVISKGDAATLASANVYADGLAANYEPSGAIATAKTELQGKIDTVSGKADAAQAAATQAQNEVDALELLVGTLPQDATVTTVVEYVNKKTEGIASDAALNELTGRVTQAETDIDNIQKDYLVSTDKTELADAIAAEASRADTAEKANAAAIKAIADDYLKGTDKTELQGGINTNAEAIAAIKEDVDAFFADADMTENAKDTLKELQAYIASDETAASEMLASIQQNGKDIDALEGRMDAAEGKITVAEGKIAANEGAIADLEAKFGEGDGSVSDMISDAVQAEKERAVAAEEAAQAQADKGVADAAAALKAAQDASAHADSLNTAMNDRMTVVEGKAHEHSNKALLDTYTQTEANLADAVAKKHEHANATVLDGITAEKVTAWDKVTGKADQTALQAEIDRAVAAEQALDAKIAEFEEVSEAEINSLFTA